MHLEKSKTETFFTVKMARHEQVAQEATQSPSLTIFAILLDKALRQLQLTEDGLALSRLLD